MRWGFGKAAPSMRWTRSERSSLVPFTLLPGGVDDELEAAAWVVKLSASEADISEFEAFEAWLAGSPNRAALFDRALAAWSQAGSLGAAAAALEAKRPRRRQSQLQGVGTPARWAAAALPIAAAVLLAFGFLDRPQEFRTISGQRETVALQDGSRLVMNAKTRLSVKLSRARREVRIAQGEAAFDVAKDASRPFLINIGARQVRVVGTEFDVKADGSALTVSVRRGVVEVAAGPDQEPVRLTPGQQLVFADAAPRFQVRTINPDLPFLWKEDRLVYRNTRLSDVVEALNARFGEPFISADAAAAQLPFSGVVMLDARDQVLRRLALVEPVSTRSTPKGIILSVDPKRAH